MYFSLLGCWKLVIMMFEYIVFFLLLFRFLWICIWIDEVRYFVLLFVDGVLLVGVMDFWMDDWGVDVVFIGF